MGEDLWEAQKPYLDVIKHLSGWIDLCDKDIRNLGMTKEEEE